jgi:hypothetical protein
MYKDVHGSTILELNKVSSFIEFEIIRFDIGSIYGLNVH